MTDSTTPSGNEFLSPSREINIISSRHTRANCLSSGNNISFMIWWNILGAKRGPINQKALLEDKSVNLSKGPLLCVSRKVFIILMLFGFAFLRFNGLTRTLKQKIQYEKGS